MRRLRRTPQNGWCLLLVVLGTLEVSSSFQQPHPQRHPRIGAGQSTGAATSYPWKQIPLLSKTSHCQMARYEPQRRPLPPSSSSTSSANNPKKEKHTAFHQRQKYYDPLRRRRINNKRNNKKDNKLVVLQQSSTDSMEPPRDETMENPMKFMMEKAASPQQQPQIAPSSSSSSSSWAVSLLFPLWLVYVSNQWSRFSLSYVVDFSSNADSFHAMNMDLHFDQSQYGMLASVAFTALFAVFSLVAGIASDRYDRKLLTIGSASLWSVATLGTAMSHSYEQVLGWRIVMGLACAFTTPTAYTLLQQYVPSHKTGLASSLYGSGVALGGGLAGLTVLLDTSLGWSDALLVISIFGFTSVLLAWICLPNNGITATTAASLSEGQHEGNALWVHDTKARLAPLQEISMDNKSLAAVDQRTHQKPYKEVNTTTVSTNAIATNHHYDSTASSSTVGTVSQISNFSSTIGDEILQVVSTSRIQWLFIGSVFRFCSGMCIGIWSAPYFRLAFADHISEYAYAQACITAICGISSNVMGGLMADWISSSKSSLSSVSDVDEDDAGKKMWVPIGGSLLAIPAWYMAIHSTSFECSMAWLALEYMVAECWFGPTINVLQSTVNSKVEGTAQGMFAFTGALGNLAPTMLGFAIANSSSGQSQETTPTELAGLLSIAVCGGYILSAICFAMSATSTTQTTKKTL